MAKLTSFFWSLLEAILKTAACVITATLVKRVMGAPA